MNADLLQRTSFIVTLGLLTATAAVTIDMSLPAIPAMVDALATTLPRAQQIVGAFMIGMACGQIPMGLFSDRLGRLPTLYAGMSLFAAAGIVVASSNDMTLLLAARFVQGFGAASAIVLSRAILRDVAAGKELARLMSLMTMIFTAAPVVAPTLGALLVAQWGWRAPFIVIAALGVFIIVMIRLNLVETHYPDVNEHPVRQLVSSFREFFSHRQSIFGLLMIVMLPLGFMSIIAVSAAMVVEIYGFTIRQYGLIFACAGISILIGSAFNRWLVTRFDQVQLIGLGVVLLFAAGAQLALIAWLDAAPFWWLWSCVCLYMFTVPIVMSNAMVIALDPLPRIAGVATSIIGTTQNIVAATGALGAAAIYDNSVRNSVLLMACAGIAVTCVFLLRPLIAPGDLVHHPDELARD
ncbi:MAG: multidrug effflux MFS transporter [Gammaproteobacteria bacterium]|nr:multidrug effflux MFS transporter [Gammaproteobacteria bacterium]